MLHKLSHLSHPNFETNRSTGCLDKLTALLDCLDKLTAPLDYLDKLTAPLDYLDKVRDSVPCSDNSWST
ncbi:hypothetical protein Bpfe_030497 [Biomphalaria pfeifferi]|uniref:Uncharacterized protein n=1 Tax=Biomphalaria pfeifferi TaxID=112525 RepID=A0AAD8APK1_BIOPF|nr:hypothetical protein Bpfe_030497 [Biomphalaria pfeifferi]